MEGNFLNSAAFIFQYSPSLVTKLILGVGEIASALILRLIDFRN
jgi:hypothetical protein